MQIELSQDQAKMLIAKDGYLQCDLVIGNPSYLCYYEPCGESSP